MDLCEIVPAKPRLTGFGGDGKQHDITPEEPKLAYYIGRCPVNGCKARPIRISVWMQNFRRVKDQMFLGPRGYQPAYSYTVGEWKPIAGQPFYSGYDTKLHCIFHHWEFRWKLVNGVYSEARKCDARCMNARGGDCECQCGGANHGAAFDIDAGTKLIKIT